MNTIRNAKVIVINGLSRGGTNVVWNILQSHPLVCSPILETGRLLHIRSRRGAPLVRALYRALLSCPRTRAPVSAWMDARLYAWKCRNARIEEQSWKTETARYTPEEAAQTVLCAKSVDQDIVFSDFFARTYDPAYFIGLVRNGYAVCEGWVRRGRSPDRCGRIYRDVCRRMLHDRERFARYTIVRFEDVLDDPFGVAERLFRFCDLTPVTLPKLRLKSKLVLNPDGSRKPRFGDRDRKYWMDRETIGKVLDAGVTERQVRRLDPRAAGRFERHAAPILRAFGYARAAP